MTNTRESNANTELRSLLKNELNASGSSIIAAYGSIGHGSASLVPTAPLLAASKHLLKPNGSISGREVASVVLSKFPNLLSSIPSDSTQQAIASIDGRKGISHREIHQFLSNIGPILHEKVRVGRAHRIAVVLPNGPELALAILAVTCWASCVPLNAFAPAAELQADIEKCGADCIIGLDPHRTGACSEIQQLASKLNIPFCGLVPDRGIAGVFELIPPSHFPTELGTNCFIPRKSARSLADEGIEKLKLPSQHNDEVLVLFTSGTTGSKKLVPHLLADVLVATACISVSWDLSPSDTNCNLMPLFHVGGIIRQVFSPVLSGGCVICCPSFDPLSFWQILMNKSTSNYPKFTWYYAAPTMHQLILQTGRAEGYIAESTGQGQARLRMIANAAGGLLPSLARELRQAFGANVLPSYGMTECMPISSPPSNYQLEKPGTSGVAVGPELSILNKATLKPVPAGVEGPICVRHEPCFRGYGMLFSENKSNTNEETPITFLPTASGDSSGWFDTGDLGYMDSDGYLFITGRSKEVINRGGEIISPMEVEEAIIGHPDVEACAAFSTPHALLQEVVGIVLVLKSGRPRIDITALHEYLGDNRLSSPKWPQCLVYMVGGLPKAYTNKLLRVNLGKRLNLPELNDNMHPIERTFEAICPPQGTEISVPIPCENVSANAEKVQQILQQELVTNVGQQKLIVVKHPTKFGALVAYIYNLDRSNVVKVARTVIDAYAIPSHICMLTSLEVTGNTLPPPQSSDAIGSILQEEIGNESGPCDPIMRKIQELMQALLDLDCLPPPNTSFFNLGGSSLLASQLAAKVRKTYTVAFSGAEVFQHSSCHAIASIINERRIETSEHVNGSRNSTIIDSSLMTQLLNFSKSKVSFEQSRDELQPGFFAILFQLLPLCFIYPAWQLTRIFLFFQCLLFFLNEVPGPKNLLKFITTLVVFHLVWVTIAPLFFIVIKWTIIGKYQKGRYPIWGSYYLRWWIVDVLRKMIGRGSWGANERTLNLYYRMLGAQIGKGAKISAQADLAEYDLVSVGDGAAVELSTIRAFGVDNGCMILGPVTIGVNSSVGVRSVAAPYTTVPNFTHLGPVSSSYEINTSKESTDAIDHFRYNRQAMPKPSTLSQIFVIAPIMLAVNSFSHIPALAVLYWMLHQPWNYEYPFQTIGHMMQWFCEPRRIPFFIGIRIARSLLSPFFYMFPAILIKWFVIGKFKAGPRDTKSEWQLIRHALAAELFTRESVQQVAELVGRHYELVSVLYRLLGAKVGKRVFWPGRQPLFTGEFDLLEIGDDVVFGSRSSIFCTTIDSAEKVILCAGSNVSDNTVVLPGSIIGKGTVLGSNSLCPAGRYLPELSVWFGVKDGLPVQLEKGVEEYDGALFSADVDADTLQMQGDQTTIKPFGKAFYFGHAPYYVYPLWLIILFTSVIRILVSILSTLSLIGAVHGSAGYFYGWPIHERDYYYIYVPFWSLYTVMLSYFFVTHFIHTAIWLISEVVSKWVIIGRRQEGRYNYDQSTYCQNWELYQITSQVRDLGRMNFLDFICGTPFMATYFRMLGGKVGDDCCLYPSGGDPYMPEPDLVDFGDRCVIDCASVICHLNTSGNFELVKITLENNVTLRTRSRIQQGVYMESGSMLLEKCLAMTGEVIDMDSVWFGAPASRLMTYDTSSVSTSPSSSSLSSSSSPSSSPGKNV